MERIDVKSCVVLAVYFNKWLILATDKLADEIQRQREALSTVDSRGALKIKR